MKLAYLLPLFNAVVRRPLSPAWRMCWKPPLMVCCNSFSTNSVASFLIATRVNAISPAPINAPTPVHAVMIIWTIATASITRLMTAIHFMASISTALLCTTSCSEAIASLMPPISSKYCWNC